MKTMRAIAFMLSVATLSSVSLPSANALAKAPLLDPFEVPEAASLQPTSQPASLQRESMLHKMTIAQAVPSFPLTGSAPETRVGREQYIETNIIISNTRRIDGVTRTRTTRNTNGFVGVVEVILTDKDGNILFVTPQQRFAVEGKLIPGPSDRTDRWLVDIPANVPLDKITGYVIVQRNSPPRSFLDTLGGLQKAAEEIKGIIKLF
jgi:hypothetical protein